MAQTIKVGIRPREQFRPFILSDARWSIIVAHRRAGKTVACIQKLVKSAVECDRVRPRFAYFAPLLKQAKTVAWDYLKQYALKIPGTTAHESELRVDFPDGAQIRLYGADNPDAVRGIYLDGVVLDEAADMSPRIFPEIIRPALSDRKGWCIWIGTPKGQNEFHELWESARGDAEWFRLMLRASETGLVDADELRSAQAMMTPEQYAQEYECSFQAAIIGAYYGREMEAAEAEGRISTGLYDPGAEVNTAWDLGASDATVIWFYQRDGYNIRFVDYYAATGWGLDHYAKVLQDRKYRYGRHHFPHDVEAKVLSGGEVAYTRRQTLEGLGVPVTVTPKWSVDDGINAVRRILPRCWFDRDKCAEGIKALRQYRREWDDQRKVFYERPLHDWASDPADAMRYAAISMDMPRANNGKPVVPNRQWVI